MKIKLKNIFKKHTLSAGENQPEEAAADVSKTAKTEQGFRSRERLAELWDKVRERRNLVKNRNKVFAAVMFVLLFGTGAFLFFHTGSSYITVKQVERNDINGTQYLKFGKNFLKYSADGVSCVDSNSQVLWSTTFTMQTPLVDVCGTAAVVAEQQGTQVYVFDADGLKGQFQTLMPVEKVRVAQQGVVAAVLEGEEESWVNFYEASGTLIAENRTSLDDFGYPLELDLSPDGLKLAVSYLQVLDGKMNTRIAFYHFGSAGQAQMNNLVGELDCGSEVAPELVFCDNSTAVAFRSDGFTVFSGKHAVREKKTVEFEQEVLSTFYDSSRIGFVFESDDREHKYQIQVYNLSGKRILKKNFDLDYKSISLQNDHIVLFNEQEFAVYKLNGQKKFQGKYRKPIENVLDVRGFRKYMILTGDSADLIRLG